MNKKETFANGKKETKKRYSFAIYPTKYDNLQKIAYVKRRSIGNIIDELITEYVNEHSSDLAEYDKIISEDN